MSYGKDDHAHTRGVGAVAAFDGSPARQARARLVARALARRDAVMSRHALGRINQTEGDGGGGAGSGGPSRPPPPGRPLPPKPLPPRPVRSTIKLPGTSVVDSVAPSRPTKPPVAPPLPAPPKPPATIVVGSGIVPIVSGGGPKATVTMPDFEPSPDVDIIVDPVPAPAAPSTSTSTSSSSKLLLYAALGMGAWWLLTRKK